MFSTSVQIHERGISCASYVCGVPSSFSVTEQQELSIKGESYIKRFSWFCPCLSGFQPVLTGYVVAFAEAETGFLVKYKFSGSSACYHNGYTDLLLSLGYIVSSTVLQGYSPGGLRMIINSRILLHLVI